MTMLAPTALGLGWLADLGSFERDDIGAEEIAKERVFGRSDIELHLPLLTEPEALGRHDPADASSVPLRTVTPPEERRDLVSADVDAVRPRGASFVLAHDGRLEAPEAVGGRRRIQLCQPRGDDPAGRAIAGLELRAAEGVRHLVVAWPSLMLEIHPALESGQEPGTATERVGLFAP